MNQDINYKNYLKQKLMEELLVENDQPFTEKGLQWFKDHYPWLTNPDGSLPGFIPGVYEPFDKFFKYKWSPIQPKKPKVKPTFGKGTKGVGIGVGLGLLPGLLDKATDYFYPSYSPPTVGPERFKSIGDGGYIP